MRDEPSLYRLELTHTAPWVLTQQAASVSLGVEMHAGTRLNSFLHNLIYVTLLPTLLHTEDINSMAFSIESRVPFLDHRLVQLCFSMPNDHKIGGGETKRVLRSAMRGLVPDPVLDRKDKTGFITPGHITWLRGALSSTLEGTWSELDGIVDHRKLHGVLDAYRRGDNANALFVWRLAMLRLFMRAHTGATAA
jgi:asparagine synthase (glutamine-hydrolysing)